MIPIHFQGLNCYHDCVVSIVNYFGLDYSAAFATLWSETDFRYDPYREAYLTKSMIAGLEPLGAKVVNLNCGSPEDVEAKLSAFHEGEFMIVGMDAYHIPWNQFYRTFHGPHYFIAQNADKDMLPCVDPTYNKANENIARREIIKHTFDMIRVHRVVGNHPRIEAEQEAREVVGAHPNTRRILLSQMYGCVNGDPEIITLLAKYIDAMICNRYLYRFYLENHPTHYERNHLFRDSGFFAQWMAVKNGLYKASVVKDNELVVKDVCGRFGRLIDDEIAMAEAIIQKN